LLHCYSSGALLSLPERRPLIFPPQIMRLQTMHTRGVLHRDIQLGNCVIGLPPNDKLIYMIDFGFSKQYIDPYTKRHIPDSKLKRDFIGNYWFRY